MNDLLILVIMYSAKRLFPLEALRLLFVSLLLSQQPASFLCRLSNSNVNHEPPSVSRIFRFA